MDRREFLKRSIMLGMGVGFSMLPGPVKDVVAADSSKGPRPDLVGIKGDDPAQMFDAGIKQLGGMSSYVSKGDEVLVKPNIGWNTEPKEAGDTNPWLVKRVIEHCYEAGAKKVYVFDHTCDYWKSCYKTSKIEAKAKEAGAKVVPAHNSKFYKEVNIPGAETLTDVDVHKLYAESDVVINIPILKSHHSTGLTISMKNLMGVVMHRGVYHSRGLNDCITDFCLYRKPDLNIVDAYRIMLKHGPKGIPGMGVTKAKTQLISPDIVAADAAATKTFGKEPFDVNHIKMASEKNIGTMNLDQLKVKKIRV